MAELQLELWRQMLAVRHDAWLRFLRLLQSDDERIALRADMWLLDRLLAVPTMVERLEETADPISLLLRIFVAS